MENAGFQSAIFINSLVNKQHIYVVCGKGHNAGDGFVLARHLFVMGKGVSVILCEDINSLSALTKKQYERCSLLGVNLLKWSEFVNSDKIENSVIVDAIFGIGFRLPLNDNYIHIFSYLNKQNSQMISLDVPSGLVSENYSDLNPMINADYILSYAFLKKCFFIYKNKQSYLFNKRGIQNTNFLKISNLFLLIIKNTVLFILIYKLYLKYMFIHFKIWAQ